MTRPGMPRRGPGLRDACALAGVEYELNPGEGAFYGPKLEFVLRDAIRARLAMRHACRWIMCCRSGWTRPTSPMTAPASDPVMLHRAILGSFERFPGHPDRAICRPLPALAGAGAGGGRLHRVRCAEPYAEEVAEAFRQRGTVGRSRMGATRRSTPKSASTACSTSRSLPWSAARRRENADGGAAPARRAGAGGKFLWPTRWTGLAQEGDFRPISARSGCTESLEFYLILSVPS